MFNQILSVVGSLLVLAAYFALQRGHLTSDARVYSAMNFFGAALMTWVAASERQAGFILLEGVWALLSLPGMLRKAPPTLVG